MADSLPPAVRTATTALVIDRLALLIQEQNELAEKRKEIVAQQRRIDRGIADCRAVTRLFELEVTFPSEDREDRERINLLYRQDLLSRPRPAEDGHVTPQTKAVEGVEIPASHPVGQKPAIKSLVLGRLRWHGAEGVKASALREYLLKEHGITVHDKTVGMTLYRLLRQGLALRQGIVWYPNPRPSALSTEVT